METQVHLNYAYKFSLYVIVTTEPINLEVPPVTTV